MPLALFEVFKSAEHKDTDMVNVIEVLLILALFCTGDVRDQLMFCFELFDDDNSDSMDQEEMTNFLWVLASASNKIGMVDPMPTRREVHKVAGGMFALADVGNKGTESGLSSQHFINWAQNHVIGSAILDSVEKVRVCAWKASGLVCVGCGGLSSAVWRVDHLGGALTARVCCGGATGARFARTRQSRGAVTNWTPGHTPTSSQRPL